MNQRFLELFSTQSLRCLWQLVIALLMSLAGVALAQSSASNVVSTTASNSVAALQSRLLEHISQPRFAQAHWGVVVASLDTGKILFEHDSDKLMIPASNAKLFTGALALDRLGADYRIKTSILAPAKPGINGEIVGDLVIYGRGDPTLSARYHSGNHAKVMQPLVNALADAGIKRIQGDLVGDSTYFQSPPFGDGWAWDDSVWAYAPVVSALCLEDNATGILVKPGKQAGTACQVITRPNCLVIQNRTLTLPEGAASTLELRRSPNQSEIWITGGLPVGGSSYSEAFAVPNPPLWFMTELEHALAQRGIVVAGRTRIIDTRDSASSNLVEIAHVLSPPLREIVKETLKSSQNLGAQLLFLQTGAFVSGNKGQSAERAAQAEMRKFLRDLGIKPGTVYLKEGTGLSSACQVAPTAAVGLLTAMTRHKNADAFVDSLPISSVDGTLADRFKGTIAEKRIRAKTGTKEFISAISGYAVTLSNERLVFSVMLNSYKDPSGTHTPREETDALVRMLVQ